MTQREKHLANFLKNARAKAGLSQKEVANRLGYETPQFISNWERGISAPPVSSIKKLAHMYGVSAEKMFELFLADEIVGVTENLKRKFKKIQ